jgi:hypothetical protein
MMRLVCALALIVGAASCKDAASAEECKQAFTGIVDMQFADAGAKAESPELKAALAKQKQATIDATGPAFISTCEDKTPRSVVTCMLAAKSTDDLKACDSGK